MIISAQFQGKRELALRKKIYASLHPRLKEKERKGNL